MTRSVCFHARAALVLVGCLAGVQRAVAADFNGDGFDDLAVVDFLDPATGGALSGVHILYGSASGLATTGHQCLIQTDDPTAIALASDHYGETIAIGDFDDDGFDDLAVSAPTRLIGNLTKGCGAVYEYRGGASGLAFRRLWHQNVKGVKDKCEKNEAFGSAMASGDFDGDGFGDLAIGVLEKIGSSIDAGAVCILRGSVDGLGTKGNALFSQNSPGIKSSAKANEKFGCTDLAAGDLNGDGFDDLAIAAPLEKRKHDGLQVTGDVAVLFGSEKGLSSKGNLLFDAFDLGETGVQPGSSFAASLRIGDLDGDGKSELLIGEISGGSNFAGIAWLVHGGGTKGLDLATAEQVAEPTGAADDFFGNALAIGDFDGDGRQDFAIGAPGADPNGVSFAGTLSVYLNSSTGFDLTQPFIVDQASFTGIGSATAGGTFGSTLAVGDFSGDGATDLASGVPGQTVSALPFAGTVAVLEGVLGSGPVSGTAQVWSESSFAPTYTSVINGLFGNLVGP